ncbi:MAG: hypothetical protein E2O40_02675 [Planctomycetota bacterium]|nr:MAG: hypothetical protein E2O40_02675 [Planctomycetota bacterium]
MVTRSTSGTGVVVSLVVFVLCTVFLLVLTIVFYAGQTKAREGHVEAEATLAKYVTKEQRGREAIKAMEANIKTRQGESVVRNLLEQQEAIMQYVAGYESATLDSVRNQFKNLGVAENTSVRDSLQRLRRDLNSRQSEIEGYKTKVTAREGEISHLEDRMEQARENHQQELNAVVGKIAAYEQAAGDYRDQLNDVKSEYYGNLDRLKDRYEGDIARLENEKDNLFQERVILKERLDELQSILSVNRLRAQNPALLVDGMVLDTTGSDEVYLNRGKEDRMVLGMTFEVYDDEAALQDVDRLTGALPRGKASLQVIQVRATTSKCKITRSIPGRPVVRHDVVANAVYDPNYIFKFLVHGKFDVDLDGKPTETEADFLRSLIVNWGGEVVSGEQLPGDLDFLVLGVEPREPMPPRPDATEFELDAWVQKRRAHERYHALFHQASEAQIPVLNSNRFFILIGYTDR